MPVTQALSIIEADLGGAFDTSQALKRALAASRTNATADPLTA